MNLQDNVRIHSERVTQMLEVSLPLLQSIGVDIDEEYLLFLGKYHDFTEAISPVGDIPSPFKASFDEKDKIIARKLDIISLEMLIRFYNFEKKIKNGKTYRSAFVDILDKISLESQILSYMDKLDAFFTCVHESFSGNTKKYKQK